MTYIDDGEAYSLPSLPKYQAPATLNQSNPVSGTKYTVLDTTKNVRIICAYVKVTWTVQPTPLEMHITIDGQTITASVANPTTATRYYLMYYNGEWTLNNSEYSAAYRAFAIEARSIKIEVETTGGTVSNLSAAIQYAKW